MATKEMNRFAQMQCPLNDGEMLAAIDLGSNSFHLAIAKVQDGKLKKIAAMSEKVQLALGLDKDNKLGEAMQDKGLACLSRFVERISDIPSERIRIVATNTLRQAVNANDFIIKANKILPRPVEVVSGREEARLIYLGVAHGDVVDKRQLVIDIGGGSTELIIGQGFEPILTESMQVGSIGFTKRFFADGQMNAEAFERAIAAAKQELMPIVARFTKKGWEMATGSSGTVKAVHGVLFAKDVLDHKKRITLSGVNRLKDWLIEMQYAKDINLPSVKEHRKPILAAGVAILIAVMELFDIKHLTYNDNALKEGVMYDMLGRMSDTDVRNYSIERLMDDFNVDKKQSKRVQKTAKKLFNAIKIPLSLTTNDRDDLLWAAQLHEIGIAIGHSRYHKHSAYILANAEIAGFSQVEQYRLSQMVAHHRRELRVLGKHARLAKNTQHLILLLRLAVMINLSRKDERDDILLSIKTQKHWQISLAKSNPVIMAQIDDEIGQFAKWGVRLELV